MADLFNDPTMQGMQFALNSLSLREQVLANNIANAQTPNYSAQDVNFQDQLASILSGTTTASPMDLGSVVQSPDVTTSDNGNSVGMEAEMSKMSQTDLLYNSLTQLTADRMSILKNAITG